MSPAALSIMWGGLAVGGQPVMASSRPGRPHLLQGLHG
jgi:hypothetical protein